MMNYLLRLALTTIFLKKFLTSSSIFSLISLNSFINTKRHFYIKGITFELKAMTDKFSLPTVCGLICDICSWFKGEKEPKCPGCSAVEGKPFWGACQAHQCAQEHQVEHCGVCKEFPCETMINQYDPNHPKGPQEAIFRIGQLAIRAKIGTEEWLRRRANNELPGFD